MVSQFQCSTWFLSSIKGFKSFYLIFSSCNILLCSSTFYNTVHTYILHVIFYVRYTYTSDINVLFVHIDLFYSLNDLILGLWCVIIKSFRCVICESVFGNSFVWYIQLQHIQINMYLCFYINLKVISTNQVLEYNLKRICLANISLLNLLFFWVYMCVLYLLVCINLSQMCNLCTHILLEVTLLAVIQKVYHSFPSAITWLFL